MSTDSLKVFDLSGSNAPDYDRLLRVLHLLKGPELLFYPATVLGVLGVLGAWTKS